MKSALKPDEHLNHKRRTPHNSALFNQMLTILFRIKVNGHVDLGAIKHH